MLILRLEDYVPDVSGKPLNQAAFGCRLFTAHLIANVYMIV